MFKSCVEYLTPKSDQHLNSPNNMTLNHTLRSKNTRNNQQLKRPLIVKQTLQVSTLGNIWGKVRRICILMFGVKGWSLKAQSSNRDDWVHREKYLSLHSWGFNSRDNKILLQQEKGIFLLKKQLKVECNCKSVLHFKLHFSLSWPTTSYMPS